MGGGSEETWLEFLAYLNSAHFALIFVLQDQSLTSCLLFNDLYSPGSIPDFLSSLQWSLFSRINPWLPAFSSMIFILQDKPLTSCSLLFKDLYSRRTFDEGESRRVVSVSSFLARWYFMNWLDPICKLILTL